MYSSKQILYGNVCDGRLNRLLCIQDGRHEPGQKV
jgi:hypothetical protein